jgi:hypothetical protein
VGVSFPQAGSAEPGDADLAGRVAKLEAEIVALKRVLKKMKAEIDGPDADVA